VGELLRKLFGLGGEEMGPPEVPPPPGVDPNLPPETLRQLELIRRSGLAPGNTQFSVGALPFRGQLAAVDPRHPNQAVLNPYTAGGTHHLGTGEPPTNPLAETLLHEMSHSGELASRDIPGRQQLMREQSKDGKPLPYHQRPEEVRAMKEAERLLDMLLMDRKRRASR
jgi:hypothetical protein